MKRIRILYQHQKLKCTHVQWMMALSAIDFQLGKQFKPKNK